MGNDSVNEVSARAQSRQARFHRRQVSLAYALLAYVDIRANVEPTVTLLVESRERGANTFARALCAVDEATAEALNARTYEIIDRLGCILDTVFADATEMAEEQFALDASRARS